MEPESSLLHSQAPAIWPCTRPNQPSPYAQNDTVFWVAWEAVESKPYDS